MDLKLWCGVRVISQTVRRNEGGEAMEQRTVLVRMAEPPQILMWEIFPAYG
jgi:hypothetical protein